MFTHLHCHSHFSLLDGLSQLDPLLDRVRELGMSSVALTDHGVMYGAVEFYSGCRDRGLKPILGLEAYIAPRSMREKEGKVDADYSHLTLLAENETGYRNLIWLTTKAHLEGFYYKPRIDLQLLKERSEGLICLTGCWRGEVPRALTGRTATEAQNVLEKYLAIFGEDRLFVELQRNALSPELKARETELNQKLVELARANNLPLVATADCHYIYPEDSEAQDVLVCIGTGRQVQDTDRLDMRGFDASLKSPERMAELFSDLPEAIANTQVIAGRCSVEIALDQRYFPTVAIPSGETPDTFLKKSAFEGAVRTYGQGGQLPGHVAERLDYELSIIAKKGFSSYFLMVADIVRGAHSLGAITNTRGSAAGSLVSHVLGISDIDPLYYQLPFERFLNPYRPTPPDIDLDISDDRRDETIAWITDRYGHDKVAQIITFGTMLARAVVRDVGRALGVPYSKCDQIAKLIPLGRQGFEMTLKKALAQSQELRDIVEHDPETNRIWSIAERLEGCKRHASIHAAAIAITPTPLTDYCPLQREPDGQRLITQYDMYSLDAGASSKALGVIKMDLLGIRNLSILEKAVKIAEKRHGTSIDIHRLPHPDPKTFKLLSDGHTFGVFQLGSSGMTRYLKELKPKTIFDIMAMIALYRPGPMGIIPQYIRRSNGQERVDYFDPRMREYLERSNGLIVYQDDVLLTAINIAGYSWEEADKLRKAMGKKIPEEMAKQKVKFMDGCIKNGLRHDQAEELFKLIEPFAAYGFGRAHAASYSQVSYQTAYMKANYPVEFMAAVMTAESGDETKIYAAVEECKAMGLTVLPPDVQESRGDFTVVDDRTIRFGLNAIKNLGSDVIARTIQVRKEGGPFSSLEDFLSRAYTKNFNKRSWEALVKAGALDRFGERGQLLASSEEILEFTRDSFKSQSQGQSTLFGSALGSGSLRLKEAQAATEEERLTWEKEHLGMYVSAHPLDRHRKVLRSFPSIGSLGPDWLGRSVTLGGIITSLKRTVTKKNDPMAFFTLQDLTGNLEALVFPKGMEAALPWLVEDQVVQVSGKISDKDEELKLLVDEVRALPTDELYGMLLSEMEKTKRLVIHVQHTQNPGSLNQIKAVLEANPGQAQVYLSVGVGPAAKKIRTRSQVRVSSDVVSQLRQVPDVLMVDVN